MSALTEPDRIPAEGNPSHAQVAVSIVSHGHGRLVLDLVRQLQRIAEPCLKLVIVTLNIPEPALEHALQTGGSTGVLIRVVTNTSPKGFGHNHNAALATLPQDGSIDHVCVLNPDLRMLDTVPLQAMSLALCDPAAGLAYPRLVDSNGRMQDSERSLPSPANLWRRRILKQTERRIDWVSGACLMMRLRDWQTLGGFDTGFHMYCEDVDISLRVRRQIGTLVRVDTRIEHLAQRASHRRLSHLRWHVRSLLRLWRLPSYQWGRDHPGPLLQTTQ